MIKAKLAAQVAQLAADRVPFVLATVVRARHPTSVTPGDTAVVLADGTIEGFVGGQCAESSVRLYSLRALETGEPMLLRLIPGAADGEQPSDGIDGAVVEHNPCLSGGALEIFLEPQLPAPRVVIVGGSPVARALEQLATAAGYATEPGPEPTAEDLAGVTAVVVASHGIGEEEPLIAALSAGVPYVALVASTARGGAVRESLDIAPELAAQIHTPAGVDIGAQSPAEIAISILAELVVIMHANPDTESPGSDGGAGKRSNGDASSKRSGTESRAKRTAANVAVEAAEANDTAQAQTTNGKAEAQTANGRTDVQASRHLKSDDSSVATAVDFAIDPVCGMKVAISESTLHLDVAGERVYFCGTGCRVAYAAPHAPDGAAA